MARRADITDILMFARDAIDEGKARIVLDRRDRKNQDTLAELGFTNDDIFDVIHSLTEYNYYKGPQRDYNDRYGGYIWVFKKAVKYEVIVDGERIEREEMIYIKFKPIEDGKYEKLRVLSFHIDEV